MSSTSIVVKCLTDSKVTSSPHGQITIGTLILQVKHPCMHLQYTGLSQMQICLKASYTKCVPLCGVELLMSW